MMHRYMPDFCTFSSSRDPSLRVLFVSDDVSSADTCSQMYDGEGLATSTMHGRVTFDPYGADTASL